MLEEILTSQVESLVLQNKVQELNLETGKWEQVPMHPYLKIWIGCNHFSTDMVKVLPNAGGYLDQDWETMEAFMIIETVYNQVRSQRRSATIAAQKHFNPDTAE